MERQEEASSSVYREGTIPEPRIETDKAAQLYRKCRLEDPSHPAEIIGTVPFTSTSAKGVTGCQYFMSTHTARVGAPSRVHRAQDAPRFRLPSPAGVLG